MTRATQSTGNDVENINWQSVFNHAVGHSLTFGPGDALPHGRLSASLQAVTTIANNVTAGTAIERAVQADELRETPDGFKIERNGPGTGDLRVSLKNSLRTAMRNGEKTVIKSPTSSGKTYTPSTTRWRSYPEITGGQPVIIFSGTTDARDDAIGKTNESHATAKLLEGRMDSCPLAKGDYDSDNKSGNTPIKSPDGTDPSDWFDTMCEERGLHISLAHSQFEHAYEGTLPCSEDKESCRSTSQWAGIPRNTDDEVDYDVLHATHQFARVPQLIEDCNVIIDERPDFTLDIAPGRMHDIVSSYLVEIDAPITTWEGLMVRLTGDFDDDLEPLRNSLKKPDADWFTTDPNAYSLVPGIVEAIVTGEKRNHDRWVGTADYTYPTLNPNHEGPEQKVTIRVVYDSQNNIQLLQAIPDFSNARCVIGLDAYPTMPKWEANTTPDIEMESIVEAGDLHHWRRNQRSLTIVQVGENKNTWTRNGYCGQKVEVLCNALREKHGEEFTTGVTSKEFVETLENQLTKSGVDSPTTIYYGNEKSVEDFDSESVGIVAGCISPSSENVKNWIELLERDATPKREVAENYQGQEWVGEDADVAEEILADVREKKVLQACGRYARSPQQPNDGATVFVLTNVLPDEYVDMEVDDVTPFKRKQKQIVDYVVSHDGVTQQAICDNLNVSRKHIDKTLKKCLDYSWMQVDEEAGPYNADVFTADYFPGGLVEV